MIYKELKCEFINVTYMLKYISVLKIRFSGWIYFPGYLLSNFHLNWSGEGGTREVLQGHNETGNILWVLDKLKSSREFAECIIENNFTLNLGQSKESGVELRVKIFLMYNVIPQVSQVTKFYNNFTLNLNQDAWGVQNLPKVQCSYYFLSPPGQQSNLWK